MTDTGTAAALELMLSNLFLRSRQSVGSNGNNGIESYQSFLAKKSQLGSQDGFAPLWLSDFLFDFQAVLTEWAILKGRAAIFADCGLGKTLMQLVWAENVVRKTNKPVLILTPLAVGSQTVREGEKFGIECYLSRDGKLRKGINITNYERLHYFDAKDFDGGGIVCDESSILKHFGGATQMQVTRFMSKIPYRLLCTATAAPNDYHELGTSSEALGYLPKTDMLSRFFAQDDGKGLRTKEAKNIKAEKAGRHYARLAYRVSQQIGRYYLKAHAEEPFWRWVCSWARACTKPADLGFDDNGFILPRLTERNHIVEPNSPAEGMLFVIPAFGLKEEREERRRTLEERTDFVANLSSHKYPVVVWCHLNAEGDMLAKKIPGAVEVSGSDPQEHKEEAYEAFSTGTVRVLITKPKIGAWGLNWQHCAHVITFASHSFEQHYQAVRRCWRYGQKKEVVVDIVSTKGEERVRENFKRKSRAAEQMFVKMVELMNNSVRLDRVAYEKQTEVPPWLS